MSCDQIHEWLCIENKQDKFRAGQLHEVVCLEECFDQLYRMLPIGQAVLMKIPALCQDLKGCDL